MKHVIKYTLFNIMAEYIIFYLSFFIKNISFSFKCSGVYSLKVIQFIFIPISRGFQYPVLFLLFFLNIIIICIIFALNLKAFLYIYIIFLSEIFIYIFFL